MSTPTRTASALDVESLKVWDHGLYGLHKQNDQLRSALLTMVDDLGLPKFLDVPRATWDAMFRKIESLMHQNPYHNFTHICDVSQVSDCARVNSLGLPTTLLKLCTCCWLGCVLHFDAKQDN